MYSITLVVSDGQSETKAEISIEVLDALEQEWIKMIWTRMLLNKSLVPSASCRFASGRSSERISADTISLFPEIPYLRPC